MKFIAALAAFAAIASALQINEPKLDAKLDFSKSNTITWTAVESDPKEFKIQLVDQSASTGEVGVTLAEKVESKDEKYTFENFVAKPGSKYIFKFIAINNKDNTGQLAQSQTFEITKSGVKADTTTPPAGGPTNTNQESSSTSSSTGGAVATAVGVAGPIAAALFAFLA